MKVKQFSVALIFVMSASVTTVIAQALPAKVRTYLTDNYRGWKQTAVANGCYASFRKSVIVGDFDSNGKSDYAVKFIHGRRGHILAFLSRGTDYKPYRLESMSASELKNTGLNIARRGERIEGEDVSFTLTDDTPVIGTCASHPGFYRFRSGDFKPL